MPLTNIPDQHCFLLDPMSSLPVCLARVDSVLVVQAFADRETLHDFVAHGVRSDGDEAPISRLFSDCIWYFSSSKTYIAFMYIGDLLVE